MQIVSSSSDQSPLLCHINIARGFRGGERQTELLVARLADRGWRQRVIGRRGEPLTERVAAISDVEVCEVTGNPVAAMWAARGSDLVHAHETRAAQAAWLLKKLGGTPYLITRRVDNPIKPSWVTRDMYKRATAVASVSAAIGSVVSAYVPTVQCEIVPDAHGGLLANPGEVASIRDRFAGKFLIGHIGALDDSHKGQLTIIDAARRMQDTDACFLLIGSGRDEVLLRAAAAGLGNVHFVGYVENVADYLAVLDVFVFPSRHEGLGSTLLDAMAFGLPIIASRVGGIPEIVTDPLNGFLIKPGDTDAMVDDLHRLLANEDLRRTIGAANLKTAELYNAERMALNYEQIYASMLAREKTLGVK